MYDVHESLIANAIAKDSKEDRIFGFFVLFVGALVSVIMGYVLWDLISSLTSNMQSMAADMKSMRNDISILSKHVVSMDAGITNMNVNMEKISVDVASMSNGVSHMDTNMNGMQKDMSDMNPMNLF